MFALIWQVTCQHCCCCRCWPFWPDEDVGDAGLCLTSCAHTQIPTHTLKRRTDTDRGTQIQTNTHTQGHEARSC